MSTIDSGHLEALHGGQEGSEEAVLGCRGEAVDLRAGACPGVSVAPFARRYSMNADLIFKWLKDPRFSPAAYQTQMASEGGSIFLPVEVSEPSIDDLADAATMRTAGSTSSPLLAHRVDITLSDGRRVVVEGPTVLSSVVRLVQGLMA